MNRLSKSLLIIAFALSLNIAPLYSGNHAHGGGSCCGGAPSAAGQIGAAHQTWPALAADILVLGPIRQVVAEQGAVYIRQGFAQLKAAVIGEQAPKQSGSCCSTKPVTEEERRAGVHLLLQTYNQKVADLEQANKMLLTKLIAVQQDSNDYAAFNVSVEKNNAELALARSKRDGYLTTYEKLMATPATKQHNHKHKH